jgi:hypothetical protein
MTGEFLVFSFEFLVCQWRYRETEDRWTEDLPECERRELLSESDTMGASSVGCFWPADEWRCIHRDCSTKSLTQYMIYEQTHKKLKTQN